MAFYIEEMGVWNGFQTMWDSFCRHHIFFDLDLHAKPWKLKKYYLFSKGLQKHLDQPGATRLGIGALKVPYQVKLTKMPLVNPKLTESWSRSKSSQNNIFHVSTSCLTWGLTMFLLSDFCQLWPSLTRGWLLGAPETLIVIWLSKWVRTIAITKMIKFPFQRLFMCWNWS